MQPQTWVNPVLPVSTGLWGSSRYSCRPHPSSCGELCTVTAHFFLAHWKRLVCTAEGGSCFHITQPCWHPLSVAAPRSKSNLVCARAKLLLCLLHPAWHAPLSFLAHSPSPLLITQPLHPWKMYPSLLLKVFSLRHTNYFYSKMLAFSFSAC